MTRDSSRAGKYTRQNISLKEKKKRKDKRIGKKQSRIYTFILSLLYVYELCLLLVLVRRACHKLAFAIIFFSRNFCDNDNFIFYTHRRTIFSDILRVGAYLLPHLWNNTHDWCFYLWRWFHGIKSSLIGEFMEHRYAVRRLYTISFAANYLKYCTKHLYKIIYKLIYVGKMKNNRVHVEDQKIQSKLIV